MDINQIDNSSKVKLPSSHKINKENGFKQIFDQKISETHATTPQNPINIKADVLEHGHKILNLLDNYARDLTDPSKSLRDIEPLIERIKREVSLFEAEAADNAHNDIELERLINDLAVISNVAVSKFYRGDYI